MCLDRRSTTRGPTSTPTSSSPSAPSPATSGSLWCVGGGGGGHRIAGYRISVFGPVKSKSRKIGTPYDDFEPPVTFSFRSPILLNSITSYNIKVTLNIDSCKLYPSFEVFFGQNILNNIQYKKFLIAKIYMCRYIILIML